MQDKEAHLKQIATSIFYMIDQATNAKEALLLGRITAELKPLLDSTSFNPDLGLELLEFADFKDDSLSNPEHNLEQPIATSRATIIKLLGL